jgi:hypothetical protein
MYTLEEWDALTSGEGTLGESAVSVGSSEV